MAAVQDGSPVSTRPVQPQCVRVTDGKACNHPGSFHPRRGRCKALGCKCTGWRAP